MSSAALALCVAVSRAHASLALKLDDVLGTWHGVSWPDYLLLRRLAEAPEGRLPLTQLVRPTGLRPVALLRQLLPLEKTGHIERLPQRVIALRPAGRQLVQDASATAASTCESAVRTLDPAVMATMAQGLDVLALTRSLALT
jgi:DNA-binding MarR family transcriptional regulator